MRFLLPCILRILRFYFVELILLKKQLFQMIFWIWFRKNIVLKYLIMGETTPKWPKESNTAFLLCGHNYNHNLMALSLFHLARSTLSTRNEYYSSIFVLGPVIIRPMRSFLGKVRSKYILVRRKFSATRYNICVYGDVHRADPAKCERALNTYSSLSDRFV